MVYPDSGKISRVPPYSRNNLRDASISPTGPLPSMADLSSVLRLSQHFITRSLSCRRNMVVLTTPSMQRLQPITHRWFRLFPFRSPLLRESLLISLPPGTEMFQFSGFASNRLCIQRLMTGLSTRRVSPFGHPRIRACLAAPRGFSQPSTSFIASKRPGIHRTPLVA